MEYIIGAGTGDELVVNRLVSNLIGIAMAVLLSVIPPNVMGGNPKWARKVLDEVKSTLVTMARLLLDGDTCQLQKIEKLHKSYSKRINLLQGDALYLMEDAERMSVFPFYKVDPVLHEQVMTLAVTSSFVSVLLDRAMDLTSGDYKNDFLRNELEALLRDTSGESTQSEEDEGSLATLSGSEPEIVAKGVRAIRKKIVGHEVALSSVTWGLLGAWRRHNRQPTPPPEVTPRSGDSENNTSPHPPISSDASVDQSEASVEV
jgi:hypothetical protein